MVRRILRWLGIATLLIGYPLLARYTHESAHNGSLGALVVSVPWHCLHGCWPGVHPNVAPC
jgi:hypothetical protein